MYCTLPEVLNQEVFLDKSIYPPETSSVQLNQDRHKILLTGATGYLGARLLLEILQSSSSEIYCLTRADDATDARQRILTSIKAIHPLNAKDEERIIAIKGDLSKPLLGLTSHEYQLLAAEINQIIHCAAQVNFLQPRSRLKANNVHGSIELLKLSASKRLKSFQSFQLLRPTIILPITKTPI